MEFARVTPTEFVSLAGLDKWRFVLGTIHAEVSLGSFADAANLVGQIAEASEHSDHHPDVQLRCPGTNRMIMTTHALDAITKRDVDLARTSSY